MTKDQQEAYDSMCEELGPSEIDLLDEILEEII